MEVPSMFVKEFVVYSLIYKDFKYEDLSKDDWYFGRETHFESKKGEAKEEHMLSFFVSTHGKGTKAYDKRIKTAEDWCKGSHYYPRVFSSYQEKIVQNKALSGFKFINTARRYSTSNVLFRILHPEGYIFEISSENAMEIIELCTIENGVIKDELFFDNSKYLMNRSFNKYKEQYEKVENEKSSKKIEVGDVCNIEITCVETNWDRKTIPVQYIGKMHLLILGDTKSSIYMVFRDLNDKIIACTETNFKNMFVDFTEIEFSEVPEGNEVYEFVIDQMYKQNVYDISPKRSSNFSLMDMMWAQEKPIKSSSLEYKFFRFNGTENDIRQNIRRLVVNAPSGMATFQFSHNGYGRPYSVHTREVPECVSEYSNNRYERHNDILSESINDLLSKGMIFRVGFKKK